MFVVGGFTFAHRAIRDELSLIAFRGTNLIKTLLTLICNLDGWGLVNVARPLGDKRLHGLSHVLSRGDDPAVLDAIRANTSSRGSTSGKFSSPISMR